MQIKNRIVALLAFGIWGAFIMWLCAVTGWNTWSSTSTSADVLAYLVTILLYGYCGYVYTRGKPAAVKLSVIAAAAILGVALSWLSTFLGLKDWIADGTSWHAAVTGFVIFALIAAIVPYLLRSTRT